MNTVIKVDFKQPVKLSGQEKVNLRDVWVALDRPKDFSNWVVQVVVRFKIDTDFGVFNPVVEKSGRGRPQKNFWVTVDVAKAIAMRTTNEAGDKVRAYFIDCERLVYSNNLEPQLTNVPKIMTPDFIIELATRLKTEEAAHTATKLELVQTVQLKDNAEASALTSAKMVAETEKVVVDLKANAVDTALKYSTDTAYISKHYPLIFKAAMKWRATQRNRDSKTMQENGWVCCYLHKVHEIPKLYQKDKGESQAYIFNLTDIKRVNEELTNVKRIQNTSPMA